MKEILILTISTVLLFGCSNSEKSTSSHETATHAEHQHPDNSNALELNNGEKWLVNEEMKPFVARGSELVDAYINDSGSDFRALAGQLKEQNDQLIKSCTMTGKSHDELHKWLHPHLELVQELYLAPGQEEANDKVQKLEQSYHRYHEYFQ